MNQRKTKKKKTVTQEFEEALKRGDRRKYVLRLFVTGLTPRSLEAIEEVRRLCDEHLKGRYTLEIIDIYKDPNATKNNQVFAAPTLVRLLPKPVRRIVGDMAKKEKLLAGLEIQIINSKKPPANNETKRNKKTAS